MKAEDRPGWWIEYSDERPDCDILQGQVMGTPHLCVNHDALQAEGEKLRELAVKHSIHPIDYRIVQASEIDTPSSVPYTDYGQIAILMEMVRRPPEEDLEDHVARALRKLEEVSPGWKWPEAKRVGRAEDMGRGHLVLCLDSDNDVCVTVWDGHESATVEFCNGGGGGGRSPEVRKALIALMVAIEDENKKTPLLARPA